MPSIDAKDILKGNIPQVEYFILYDKGKAGNFADAINMLAQSGWRVVQIWAKEVFHFCLLKKE